MSVSTHLLQFFVFAGTYRVKAPQKILPEFIDLPVPIYPEPCWSFPPKTQLHLHAQVQFRWVGFTPLSMYTTNALALRNDAWPIIGRRRNSYHIRTPLYNNLYIAHEDDAVEWSGRKGKFIGTVTHRKINESRIHMKENVGSCLLFSDDMDGCQCICCGGNRSTYVGVALFHPE